MKKATLVPIIPKKMNQKKIVQAQLAAAEKLAKDSHAEFSKVAKTWKGEKPKFQKEVTTDPKTAATTGEVPKTLTIATFVLNDGSMGFKKLLFIDKGTKVRYVTMQKGFIPKTRRGVLDSYKGAKGPILAKDGRPLVLKKRPRPGIKARRIEASLVKKWLPIMKKDMQLALDKGAKECGHHAK
jgi:hypothetical protein